MKKYLLLSLSFSLLFFAIAPVSGAIDTGFAQATEPTAMILFATGVVGLFCSSRSRLKK
ncbi:MAG: hypothetical protein KJO26_01680 [Deltaproteobacteria bacterium]|nr:hypothetical protein [Deltaproteobacteria bacterium]NNK86001.1 hypothetical protein [Desulfobacterales bacterium]